MQYMRSYPSDSPIFFIIGWHASLPFIRLMGNAMQHEPMPLAHAARMMFSPSRPQSIWDMPYDVSQAMNTTHGASQNIVRAPFFGFTCGLAALAASDISVRRAASSMTRISYAYLFCPLGALIPQRRISCRVSRPIFCGVYLRMLRRDMMTLSTASLSPGRG